MKRYAHIVGWGKCVPEKVLTNDELSQMVDTSDEWILARTGIRERRIVSDHETTASMSIAAAREKGLVRIEGRDYVVQDGDVCHFRFAV